MSYRNQTTGRSRDPARPGFFMTTSCITFSSRPTSLSDRGRRVLLALVTALIAAQPLVAAGDVGRVPMSTATGHYYLTAGWFVVLAGWAVWNAWAKPGRRIGGLVGAGFDCDGRLDRGASGVAPNRWLAWGTAWDWAGVAAAFVVVRQVAVATDDQRCVFAVLITTAVSALANDALIRIVSGFGGKVTLPGCSVSIMA